MQNIAFLSYANFKTDPRDLKWSNPAKGETPPPYLHVVGIEKRAFRSPATSVANFTF